MRKKLLSLLLALAMVCSMVLVPAAAKAPPVGNWYDEAMSTWAGRGIIQGDAEGNLNPTSNITRAELAVMLDRVMGYQVKAANTFSDVATGEWYTDAVLKANAAGVLKGDGAAARPGANITRQEVMVMFSRVLGLKDGGSLTGFADASDVASWAQGAVSAMVAKGYVKGSEGKLMPKANITRAEVVTLLDNIFKGYFNKAGTYTQAVAGSAVINTGDVTMSGMNISGDLIIAEGVGDGHVVLDSVTLGGRLIVRGGGENSIIIKGNSRVDQVIVARQDGKVRVAVQGGASVSAVVVDDGASAVKIEGKVGTVAIAAADVSVEVTGEVKTIEVAESAAGAVLSVDKTAKVGTVAVAAPNTALSVAGVVSKLDVAASADNARVSTEKGAKVDSVTTNASGTTVEGEKGTVSKVTVDKDATDTTVNAGGARIENNSADKVVSGSGSIAPGKTGISADSPSSKPSTGGGSSTGGGGGGGGGGSTSTANSASTASGFIDAAQKNADFVTATVEKTNSITANDDIAITNNSANTLTLDLCNANIGDLAISSANATQININGSTASVTSLFINAPKATVTNNIPVNGSVNIQAVSGSTFNNTAPITGSITMTGPGSVNDTQATPVPVIIATTEQVTVRGNSTEISIKEDGATVTLATAGSSAPTVNSSADGVNLAVATAKATISGTVETVKTTAAGPSLTIEGTVGTLDAKTSTTLQLTGGGKVDALTAKDTMVTVPNNTTTPVIAAAEVSGGSLTAPDGAVHKVIASGSVTLNASVNTVETQANTILSVSNNATVHTVAANGTLTLDGNGTIGQVDVAADAQITIPSQVSVSAVNNTGDSTSVTLAGDGAAELVVTAKAAVPTTVGYTAPTAAGGNGTLTGVTTAMEYKGSNAWQDITGTSVELAAGTYQVRVKATDEKLASEPVSVTIPAAVGVTAATIQGKPNVGQTLTAVANADATGTLSYIWKAGSTVISGATAKTFTLTDEQIGQPITVTITNYSSNSASSTETPVVTVDKTALNKLISKADEATLGVSVKEDGATAAQVAAGIVFVTKSEQTALNTAVTSAKAALNDAADTAAVHAQETTLSAAIDAYVTVKKVGTFSEVNALKSELTALLTAAGEAKVKHENDDANAVPPDEQWTTSTVQDAYDMAITSARTVLKNSSSSASALAATISDLNAAMNTYSKAIRNGAALDNTALLAAINAAERSAASVLTSTDGKDILPGQLWSTSEAKTTYTQAIQSAKSVSANVQNDNLNALTSLDRAMATFNAAKNPGTKDVAAPIVTKVGVTGPAVNQYTISFSSNEAGSYRYQLGSTEGNWITGGTFDEAGKANVSFTYTPSTPGAILYIQVSDESGNTTIVQVKVGESPENAEASIGSAKYETFEKAVAAATGGQTVRLLKDVQTEAIITIDKSLTLDTNGKTLTRGGTLTSSDTRIFLITSGTTTLTGGGTLNIKDCEAESANSMIRVDNAGAALVVNDVTVEASSNVLCSIGVFGGALTVNTGAVITNPNGSAISTNGSGNLPSANITINGGTISSGSAYAMYLPGKSQTVDINGGTITGGLEIKAGTLKVSGGEIKTTSDKTTHNPFSNGASTTGYALALVENADYQTDGNTVSVNISGGTIIGEVAKLTDSERKGDELLTINGGTFSVDPSTYVAPGYTATPGDNGFTVGKRPAEDSVASIGDTYYVTLAEAFGAAKTGETIRLEKDAKDVSGIAINRAGAELTLDLNGHTYTVTEGANINNRAFKVIAGTLNVCGNGKIIADGRGTTEKDASGTYGAFRVESDGILSLKDITLKNSRPYGLNVKVMGGTANLTNVTINSSYGGGIEVTEAGLGTHSQAGTATLTNCTFTQTGYFDHCSSAVAVSGGSSLTVDGGTYTSAGRALYVFSSGGYITVKDGTFAGEKEAFRAEIDTGTYPNYTGGLRIEGGDYTGTFTITSPASMSITGGTFSVDPRTYVAPGYQAVKNADGTYTVSLKTEPDENDVAVVGGRYFSTLAGALEAAGADGNVQLIKGFTLSEVVTIPADDVITLDLNHQTLTLDATGTRLIRNNGSLTIEGNGGKISGVNAGAYGLIDNYGTLTANQVSFEDAGAGDGASLKNRPEVESSMTLNQCTITGTSNGKGNANVYSEGELIINGGSYSAASDSAYAVICNSGECKLNSSSNAPIIVEGAKGALAVNSGTATVNGGTYTGKTYYGFWVTNDGVTTHVTINDGSFTGKIYGLYASVDDGRQDSSNANVVIDGGSFTGEQKGAAALNKTGSLQTWGMTITGGTFSSDPGAYVPSGYAATESNGIWTVAAAE